VAAIGALHGATTCGVSGEIDGRFFSVTTTMGIDAGGTLANGAEASQISHRMMPKL
jgi:hypothetical protein